MKIATTGFVVLGLLAMQPALYAQTGMGTMQKGASGQQIDQTELTNPSKCRVIRSESGSAPNRDPSMMNSRSMAKQQLASRQPGQSPSTSTRIQDKSEQISRPSEGLLVDPPSGTSAVGSVSEPSANVYCPPEAFSSSK